MDYQSVTPYLTLDGAAAFIEFVREVFDGKLIRSSTRPDGRLGHSELRIGGSMVMVSDTTEEWGATPAALLAYVEEVDDVYRRAMERGARSLREPEDTSHGDRMGGVVDRWGNQWWVATALDQGG